MVKYLLTNALLAGNISQAASVEFAHSRLQKFV